MTVFNTSNFLTYQCFIFTLIAFEQQMGQSEPAHGFALETLELRPMIDLGLRLGEGSGALMAVPIVTAAADILSGMATFGEANVSDRG